MEALFFRLDNQPFAIDLNDIDEVLNMATIRSSTDMPSFINGFFNLRGQLLPAIDLSRHLGYMRPEPPPPLSEEENPQTSYRHDTRLLLTTIDNIKMAMIIDGIEDVRPIGAADQNSDAAGTNKQTDMLIMANGETVQLIDLRQILTASELEELHSLS